MPASTRPRPTGTEAEQFAGFGEAPPASQQQGRGHHRPSRPRPSGIKAEDFAGFDKALLL